VLQDILMQKKASKLEEVKSFLNGAKKDFIDTATAPRSVIDHIDREMAGTRFTDYKHWLTKGPIPSVLGKAAPVVGAGLAGLSLVGGHDIMKDKDYKYSFDDVYWGVTGLPTYAAYRGAKKIGAKIKNEFK
jgi:hypothetical protein